MAGQFVPDDFNVPVSFEGTGYRLEPLGPEHNGRDHEAWMSSIAHVRSTPGFPDGSWPSRMSLQRNRDDLVRHAQDFQRRRGFTYSVLDGEAVIGCVYIYPSERPDQDAEVSSWVTKSRAEMDVLLWSEVSQWLNEVWPFDRIDYAERT